MSKHFQDYQNKAHKELDISLELIGIAYELSKDPKVLVSALHHLKDAQDACMNFIMYLEGKENALDVNLFIQEMKEKNSLSEEEQKAIIEVHRLCQEQKDSDVEFRRKDSYVLCNDTYDLSTLTQEKLQKYLKHTITITKKLLR